MPVIELAASVRPKESSVYDLLFHYFQINPEPTDDQIHALAMSIGQDPAAFERFVFKMLAAIVEEADVRSDFDDDFLEEAVENTELESDDEKRALYFDGTPDTGQTLFDEIVQHDGGVETEEESPNEQPLSRLMKA